MKRDPSGDNMEVRDTPVPNHEIIYEHKKNRICRNIYH